MNELDDALLNEYLDGTLDEDTRQRVEKTLAHSPEARMALAELETLFATFAEITDVSPTADLTARIVTAVQTKQAAHRLPKWIRLLPLLQLLTAAVLILLFWTTIQTWWENGRAFLTTTLGTVQLPDVTVWQIIRTWATAVGENVQIAPPQFDLATSQWALLLGLALMIWLLGNRLLFTGPTGGSHG